MASLSDIISYLGPAGHIIQDPALPQIASLVTKLHALEQSNITNLGTSRETPGIGLKYFVTPLKVYTSLRATRLHPYAILGIIAGGLVLAGYLLGKHK